MTARPVSRSMWRSPQRSLPATGRRALAALLVLALGGWEPFRTADPDVEAGNRAYAEGRYDEALAAYDRAARRGAVDGDGLAFDRGTAELKKADTARDPAEKQRLAERALEDLKQAGHARDPRIRGSAHYNRGNLLMSQDKLDDAIEAYKQALRDQPGLDDARYNLEAAMHRRRKQQQQGRQGQGQGQGQGGQPGGANGQGQGKPGADSPGQGAPGPGSQGSQGTNPPGSSPGASPDGANGSGSKPPDGANGSGASPPGGANSPGNAPGGGDTPGNPPGNGSGTPPAGSANPGDRNPLRGRPPRGRGPQSPRTPVDGKLDDLDNYSRRLQKDEARRHATGRASDPQHDW